MKKQMFLRIYFIGVLIVSGLFIRTVAPSPRDAPSGILAGFSFFQLLSLGTLTFFALTAFVLSIYSVFRHKWLDGIIIKLDMAQNHLYVRVSIPVLCGLAAFWGYVFIFWGDTPERLVMYHQRLLPLVGWMTAVSFWSLLLMVMWSADLSRIRDVKDVLSASGITAGILFAIVLFIAVSRIGIKADRVWWAAPGAPVLIWQSFIAWTIGAVFLLIESRLHFLWSGLKKGFIYNALLFVVLWAFSAWFWSGLPVQSDHFITDKFPPNFEYYPYSDAATYDLGAQELLIGNGLSNDSGSKPAYSLFLAFLHLSAGQDYERLVWLQTLILGIIPSLMFLLASQLGNRSAGLVAALLVIFREQNSILLTRIIRVSHTKMIMTEPLILAVILLLTLLLVYWFEKPSSRSALLLVIGSVLGISILLRGQMLVLVPFVIFIILLQVWKNWMGLIKAGSLILLGAVLALSPWLFRNYQIRNEISLKETLPRDWMLATKYSLTPEVRLEPPEGVPLDEYNEQMRSRVVEFVIQYPDIVAQFVSAHFFHNLIESVLYLPLNFEIDTPADYVRETPYWADDWSGSFPLEGGFLLSINLCLIAVGIGTSWMHVGRGVLVPIIISIGYVFSVSIARFSGWRFIMPVDWVPLLFYSIGCLQLTKIVYSLVKKDFVNREVKRADMDLGVSIQYPSRNTVILLCTGLLLLGLAFPVSEKAFPQVYPALSGEDALELYNDSYAMTSQTGMPVPESISDFILGDDAVILYGRALYPRYFRSGQGLGGNSPVYNNPPDSSLIFSLIGSERALVVLPLEGKPDYFPNASDVLVFGCRGIENSVNAFVVVLLDDDPVILKQPYSDQSLCPLVFP